MKQQYFKKMFVLDCIPWLCHGQWCLCDCNHQNRFCSSSFAVHSFWKHWSELETITSSIETKQNDKVTSIRWFFLFAGNALNNVNGIQPKKNYEQKTRGANFLIQCQREFTSINLWWGLIKNTSLLCFAD